MIVIIHTAQFYSLLDTKELKDICRRFKEPPSLLPNEIDPHFNGVVTKFLHRPQGWIFYVQIDFIKMLGKSNISENDFNKAEDKINDLICHIFENESKQLTLIRLDFRFDVVVPDENHRKVLVRLYKKSFEKYGFKKKYDQYESSIFFNSKSTQVICYDKQAEREDKSQTAEPHEVNVLRFEVRLANKHLNYVKRAYGTTKSLSNYMRDDVWVNYMKNHMKNLFFPGDFYKINIATNIINNSKLSEKEMSCLREFLCDVSKNGLEGIKKLMKEGETGSEDHKYSKYIMKKYFNMLKQLNINPILIPKNIKVDLGNEKCLKNPLPIIIL